VPLSRCHPPSHSVRAHSTDIYVLDVDRPADLHVDQVTASHERHCSRPHCTVEGRLHSVVQVRNVPTSPTEFTSNPISRRRPPAR
jgi:hypothetical protein